MDINRRVRAILVSTQKDRLVLLKREKPGQAPYYVAPGGGYETSDVSLMEALHREMDEEIGGTVEIIRLVHIGEHQIEEERIVRQYYYLCRLLSYDLSQRHGPEFDDPANGKYSLQSFPLQRAAIAPLSIRSPDLKTFLTQHIEHLFDLPEALG